jgi:hypothetical protein
MQPPQVPGRSIESVAAWRLGVRMGLHNRFVVVNIWERPVKCSLNPEGTMMRVGIAADHGAFALKAQLEKYLCSAGYEVADFGAHQLNPADDYQISSSLWRGLARDGALRRRRGRINCGEQCSPCARRTHS